jgi:DNA-binding CsgD family transcriptional regulator
VLFIILLTTFVTKAQYSFSGHVDNTVWHDNVYLSIIEDYRKIFGIYSEQIISKTTTDSTGFFEFSGDALENTHRIYRIHVDNCTDENENENHFNGHCEDSKEIIFIAKNRDTIQFPFSFEKQMFCDIQSNNVKTTVFNKIDSIKTEMKFAFNDYRSEANRKLNNKKWFKTLQDFGVSLNEPLAELYIYAFLSERSSDFHDFYLEDLKSNVYYDHLLNRLISHYPNSSYTKQFKLELNSDKFIVSNNDNDSAFNWNYLLWALLLISIISNVILWPSYKKMQQKKSSYNLESLTNQEQNILNLILENKSNKEIADTLFVSISTVKTHINNIFKKLNVQSREELKLLKKQVVKKFKPSTST